MLSNGAVKIQPLFPRVNSPRIFEYPTLGLSSRMICFQ